jgi:lysophospholipase L1-like esterase
MKFLSVLSVAAFLLSAAAYAQNPAAAPEKRLDWSEPVTAMWIEKGRKQAAAEGPAQILFLGDSITSLWLFDRRWPNGQASWDKYFKPMKALNFGVAGDRTENLLWRLGEGGMLQGLSPRVAVLLIGVNNLTGWGGRQGGDAPENVAAAHSLILKKIKADLPETRILVLGVLPAFEKADAPIRAKIRAVNEALAKEQDLKQVFFLDLGSLFVDADGSLDKELVRDGIHLSERGYEVFGEALAPRVEALAQGEPPAWKSQP